MLDDKDETPGITVIIPAYKAERWLDRAIDSIYKHRWLDIHLVVVEDGQYDDTASVLQRWPSVQHIAHDASLGASSARNTGLAVANTRYVLFLDADDYLEPPFLNSLWREIRTADADMCFGPWRFDGDRAYPATVIPPLADLDGEHWIAGWLSGAKRFWACTHRILWRRRFLTAIGGWGRELDLVDDEELMLRALIHKARVTTASEGCAVYWQHLSGARKTLNNIEARRQDRFTLTDRIRTALDDGSLEPSVIRPALALHCYRHAQGDFQRGFDDRAQHWLRLSRCYGSPNHVGSRSHRLLCAILGLKYKERLSRQCHRLSKALRLSQRQLGL